MTKRTYVFAVGGIIAAFLVIASSFNIFRSYTPTSKVDNHFTERVDHKTALKDVNQTTPTPQTTSTPTVTNVEKPQGTPVPPSSTTKIQINNTNQSEPTPSPNDTPEPTVTSASLHLGAGPINAGDAQNPRNYYKGDECDTTFSDGTNSLAFYKSESIAIWVSSYASRDYSVDSERNACNANIGKTKSYISAHKTIEV
jgi:hypothetical protein